MSDEPNPNPPADPYDLDPEPPVQSVEMPAPVMPYESRSDLRIDMIDKRLSWRNDGRIGCSLQVLAFIVSPMLWYGVQQRLQNPVYCVAIAVLSLGGIGLFAGFRHRAWGFLLGAVIADLILIGFFGTIYSICGR